MKKIIVSMAAAIFAFNSIAQTKDVELKLTLRDGNVMSGTSKITSVSLITDYGKLEVPIKNVSSLEVGITADKTLADKIVNLLKQLSNSNEQMRKTAFDELVKMEIRAIPAITDFIYSSKYEPSTYTDYTADAALSELQSKFGVDGNFPTKDIVAIDFEYSMGGRYDFEKIELKTEYGTLSIPKEKIKHIDVTYTGGGSGDEMTFKLLGSKHISANTNGGWLKTGIMVKTGQKINITAIGEITFASLSGAKYKPDGTVSGSASIPENSYEGDNTSASAYPTYGNVVFKIGENSTSVLKAGAKFNGNAQSSGMLYLSAYETVFSEANTGAYTVKVKVN